MRKYPHKLATAKVTLKLLLIPLQNLASAINNILMEAPPQRPPSKQNCHRCTGLPPAVPDLGWLSLVHPHILHQVKVTCLASVSKFWLVCHQPCQIWAG